MNFDMHVYDFHLNYDTFRLYMQAKTHYPLEIIQHRMKCHKIMIGIHKILVRN